MHIPDGFLSNPVSLGLVATAVVFLSHSLKKLRQSFFETVPVAKAGLATATGPDISQSVSIKNKLTEKAQKKIWQIAILGAFIFAAQMINFPVQHGTSGHLIGGVLAAILLGPSAALLIMAVVLVLQALVFADGGVLALGANIFNMGVVASLGGYYVYKFFQKRIKNRKLVAAFVAAWLSVILASLFCSFELALSKTIPLSQVLPAMVGVHALIGLGEAAITVVVIHLWTKNKIQ